MTKRAVKLQTFTVPRCLPDGGEEIRTTTAPLYLPDGEGVQLLALVAAAAAGHQQEVPVGAVLRDAAGRFLGECGNNMIATTDPTGHAELQVVRQGTARSGYERLPAATLTVTLEPCVMCQAALALARVKEIVYQARSPWLAAARGGWVRPGSVPELAGLVTADMPKPPMNTPIMTHAREMEADAGQLLRIFFAERRKI